MANEDRTTQLQRLLDRLRDGDAAARNELMGLAYDRLGRLARKILHQSFPRFENVHETGTALHETAIRLLTALDAVEVPTVADFFRLAAWHMRKALTDLARKHSRQVTPRPHDPADLASGGIDDPERVAMWTEFHEKVDALPRPERDVVDLYFYHGLTQDEAARALGISQKEVSRRWLRGIRKLPDCAPDDTPFRGQICVE